MNGFDWIEMQVIGLNWNLIEKDINWNDIAWHVKSFELEFSWLDWIGIQFVEDFKLKSSAKIPKLHNVLTINFIMQNAIFAKL